MTLSNDGSNIILTDEQSSLIHITDLEGNLLDSKNPEGMLKQPVGICIKTLNDIEEIYIGDFHEHKIFVFDSDFNYIREFGDCSSLKIPQVIAFDETEKNLNSLYVSDVTNNQITVWNSTNGELEKKLEIDSPYTIRFTINKMFIISTAVFELDEYEKNKFSKITKGSNCIFVLDKESFEIINSIKIDNWLTPSTLYIDTNSNIYTLAYEIDKNNVKTEFKYFYIIDQNNKLINKILLNDIQRFGDAIFLRNRLYICLYDWIRIIEFE